MSCASDLYIECHQNFNFGRVLDVSPRLGDHRGWKIDVPRNDQRWFRWCLGVIWHALEWSWVHLGDPHRFSEIMKIAIKMTFPCAKWSLKMRFRCAGAQSFDVQHDIKYMVRSTLLWGGGLGRPKAGNRSMVRSTLLWGLGWGCPEGVKQGGSPALLTKSQFLQFWKRQTQEPGLCQHGFGHFKAWGIRKNSPRAVSWALILIQLTS